VLGCTTKKVLAVPGSAPGVTVAVARFTAHPEVNGKTNRASANLFSIVLSLPWPIDPARAPERLPPREDLADREIVVRDGRAAALLPAPGRS